MPSESAPSGYFSRTARAGASQSSIEGRNAGTLANRRMAAASDFAGRPER